MQRRILTVEDDHAIRRGIVDILKFKGFTTFEADNGNDGLEMALTVDCDLVLLDLALPGKNGLEILEEIRRVRATLPVIILTALGAEKDRIKGLRLGADDYVVKPFSVEELIARIEAVMRRTPERPDSVEQVPFSGGVADLARCEVRYHDGAERVALSEREVELLRYLVNNSGRAISRDEILSRVWRMDPSGIETRTVDMHMARLREKLRDAGEPKILLTVRGKGYMFAAAAGTASAGEGS